MTWFLGCVTVMVATCFGQKHRRVENSLVPKTAVPQPSSEKPVFWEPSPLCKWATVSTAHLKQERWTFVHLPLIKRCVFCILCILYVWYNLVNKESWKKKNYHNMSVVCGYKNIHIVNVLNTHFPCIKLIINLKQ